MLGKAKMNPDFKKLAEYIDQTFAVKTINIIYDTINKGTPRLDICFEFENEYNQFYSNYKFNSIKQKKIADKFEQLVDGEKYITKNAWVVFSNFEHVAKIETIDSISVKEVEEFKKQLNHNDLWTISKLFTATTFFLYTQEQVKLYENSPIKTEWENKYFDIVKQYDEFGYFKRESFKIYLDSKENFDTNYDSNWYYYYK